MCMGEQTGLQSECVCGEGGCRHVLRQLICLSLRVICKDLLVGQMLQSEVLPNPVIAEKNIFASIIWIQDE